MCLSLNLTTDRHFRVKRRRRGGSRAVLCAIRGLINGTRHLSVCLNSHRLLLLLLMMILVVTMVSGEMEEMHVVVVRLMLLFQPTMLEDLFQCLIVRGRLNLHRFIIRKEGK
jgi:hypothetical protein